MQLFEIHQSLPSEVVWSQDESLSETEQPIEITNELYDQIFNSAKDPGTWFISMVSRTDEMGNSDFIMRSLILLADWYQEDVRFGWVDIAKSEFVKESFDVKPVPTSFLIKDGLVYEQNAMYFQFEAIRKFINGEYQTKTY